MLQRSTFLERGDLRWDNIGLAGGNASVNERVELYHVLAP